MLRRLDEFLLVAALCVAPSAAPAALVEAGWGLGAAERADAGRAPIGGGWAARVAWTRP